MAKNVNAHRARRSRPISLSQEQSVYDACLPRWIPEREGEHVLIKGDDVVEFYKSRDEALTAGYARFGYVPLFVKQITAVEPIYNIPNGLI
jgi:hypothetical protein